MVFTDMISLPGVPAHLNYQAGYTKGYTTGFKTSSGYKEGYDAGMQLAKQRQAAMMAPAPRPVLPAMATAQLQARPMAMAAPQMASNMVIR